MLSEIIQHNLTIGIVNLTEMTQGQCHDTNAEASKICVPNIMTFWSPGVSVRKLCCLWSRRVHLACEPVNNSLLRIGWIMDQRQKLLKSPVHLRHSMSWSQLQTAGTDRGLAGLEVGYWLQLAALVTPWLLPRDGWRSIQPVWISVEKRLRGPEGDDMSTISRSQLLPQLHPAVYFSYFHKLNLVQWSVGDDSSHPTQDLSWFKCPVFQTWRLRRVLWRCPDDSQHA